MPLKHVELRIFISGGHFADQFKQLNSVVEIDVDPSGFARCACLKAVNIVNLIQMLGFAINRTNWHAGILAIQIRWISTDKAPENISLQPPLS